MPSAEDECCNAFISVGVPDHPSAGSCNRLDVYYWDEDLPEGHGCAGKVMPMQWGTGRVLDWADPLSYFPMAKRRTCCTMSIRYGDTQSPGMVDSCIKHPGYSWDRSTSECRSADYVTAWGGRDDGPGMALPAEVLDSSECCSYAIDAEDQTSPLLWSCEKQFDYTWDGSTATRTIWALKDDGSKFVKLTDNESITKDELC